ncbi:MAG: hypothetical protein IJ575_09760 [Selenomonadaceae bacterium]|nr:hypothetical protein [Selenomonadaceae bacterium]
MLFDGDVERSIQSLDSIFGQTYEFKKLYIVLLTIKNVAELIHAMKDHSTQVTFVDRTELQKMLERQDGEYVQILQPGDKMHPNRIMHMIECANATKGQIIISKVDSNQNELIPPEIEINSYGYDSLKRLNGYNDFLIPMLQNQGTLISGISRIMCRQNIFNRVPWIQIWLDSLNLDQFNLETSTIIFLANLIPNKTILFLNEKLIQRGIKPWSQEDLDFHNKNCQQMLKQIT